MFLVASDLGVRLEFRQDEVPRLSKLASNQSDVTVTCRLLSVGPLRAFQRKSDSRTGLLNRLNVFDDTATIAVNLWDGKAVLDGSDVSPGDLIKISNAYVKPALDGTLMLNAGERSNIQKMSSTEASIATLDSRIMSADSIPEDGRTMAVRGKVSGELRRNNYTKKDGTQSELTTFSLAGETGETRVVIWNNKNPVFSKLKFGEQITLLNVRSKSSNYQNQNALELHGDEGTCILEKWNETQAWMREQFESLQINSKKEATKTKAAVPLIARVISLKNSDEEGRTHMLLVDSQKKLMPLVATGEARTSVNDLGVGDVIVCKPESIDPNSFKVVCTKSGALSKVRAKRQDIPDSASYLRTIENFEVNSIATVQVMCLSDSVSREIQTKDGLVKRSEISAADPTGEIKVYAWRNLVKLLDGVAAGDTLMLNAVEAQSHEGRKFLVLKNYSTVDVTKS